MSVTLAATFNPRGETGRLLRLYPQFHAVYDEIVISMPPHANGADVDQVQALPDVTAWVNETWPQGRYMALKQAYDNGAQAIHYADMDRLLRWTETRPAEWRETVAQVAGSDCLVIGRTPAAWATHPQALAHTEKISNTVFSRLLGQDLDLSAGSKGFSRAAVEVILANCRPTRALGADSEWIMVLQRAGFQIDTVLVDGLDWETADRYADAAADDDKQREAAIRYDADPDHWAMRVGVAQEIVEAGLDAMVRPLVAVKEKQGEDH